MINILVWPALKVDPIFANEDVSNAHLIIKKWMVGIGFVNIKILIELAIIPINVNG